MILIKICMDIRWIFCYFSVIDMKLVRLIDFGKWFKIGIYGL